LRANPWRRHAACSKQLVRRVRHSVTEHRMPEVHAAGHPGGQATATACIQHTKEGAGQQCRLTAGGGTVHQVVPGHTQLQRGRLPGIQAADALGSVSIHDRARQAPLVERQAHEPCWSSTREGGAGLRPMQVEIVCAELLCAAAPHLLSCKVQQTYIDPRLPCAASSPQAWACRSRGILMSRGPAAPLHIV